MTRAVVYTRISRDPEGEALGVERQRQDCLDRAAREGWQVVERAGGERRQRVGLLAQAVAGVRVAVGAGLAAGLRRHPGLLQQPAHPAAVGVGGADPAA
jgi:hypothetical protein